MIGSQKYIAEDEFSVADIDLLVVVDFANWIKLGLSESAKKNSQRWYEAVSQRPSANL